jgi:hypothetical protein
MSCVPSTAGFDRLSLALGVMCLAQDGQKGDRDLKTAGNLANIGLEARMKIEGGCLCGKVRYSGDTEPTFVAVCHCKNCQKATGTAFNIVVGVPTPALTIQGTLKAYADRGDSGKALSRMFCPECGSSVIDEAEAFPGMAFILAGTLDDTSWVKPGMEIFCDSAQPWVALGGERQRFLNMPPA